MTDFVILHPAGTPPTLVTDKTEWKWPYGSLATIGDRAPDQYIGDALRPHIPDLAPSSLGRNLFMWYSDTFTPEMPPNPLADHVIRALGYVHRNGWHGNVGITMGETPSGYIPPLTDFVMATIEELLSGAVHA